MKFAKKILFPADLSEVSPKIAPYVKEVASKFSAEVHIVFVARILQHFTSIYVPHPSVRNFEAEIVKGAEKKLGEFVDEHFQGVSPKAKVVLGDAAEEILNYARSEGIDLIIMGTHGRKGLEKIVFGSVAERVVQKSPVPVLTINPYGQAA
ncbi:MAG: universal stress protein [Deltaproteobacteria bacterium]|nr:MAG: universal stress protein [Deltaproteobacteria bacterium]